MQFFYFLQNECKQVSLSVIVSWTLAKAIMNLSIILMPNFFCIMFVVLLVNFIHIEVFQWAILKFIFKHVKYSYPKIIIKNVFFKIVVNILASWKLCIFQIFKKVYLDIHGLTACPKILTSYQPLLFGEISHVQGRMIWIFSFVLNIFYIYTDQVFI